MWRAETIVDTPDQPYLRALLYLQAAGHETDPGTRVQLQRLLADDAARQAAEPLEQLSGTLGLSPPPRSQRLPPIARSSMGYPE
ncbi:hypothetical protein [Marinobacter gudaonensis]|uniref:hypothetical protein n=1 Tax=Marinobacter gudaonensis TaxID=375760 RepID=UPI000B89137E|nr:hypothetical protein [Marinobacter gudaonensis]